MRPLEMEATHATRAAASAAPSLLLPFYQYLCNRIESNNLELLRRIAAEFLVCPQRLATVESMLQLAFPVVALLPVDVADASQRTHADTVLSGMKWVRDSDVVEAKRALQVLREALGTKLTLRNWDWLVQIFHDFCRGEELSLIEFVKLQRGAISIVPTPPVDTARAVEPATQQVKRRPRRARVYQPSSEDSASESSEMAREARRHQQLKINLRKRKVVAGVNGSHCGSFRGVPPHFKMTPAHRRERRLIYQEMRVIERTKPWVAMFDVSKIEYPFDPTVYVELASNLKNFWRDYAQVVWERPFWYRLDPRHGGAEALRQREARQLRASDVFIRSVVVPAYKTFGPQFFVDLDNRKTPFYWWWYRRPAVNILSIGIALGLAKCLAYIRENATKRFPDAPRGFEVRAERHNGEMLSMWSTQIKEASMREAIEQLKRSSRRSIAMRAVPVDAQTSDNDLEDY